MHHLIRIESPLSRSNLAPVTVQRQAHTRKNGVKVRAHAAIVQKAVAPAAAEISGPLAGPVGPVEKPANALGLSSVGEVAAPAERTFANIKEAAVELSRLAHAATPRRIRINQEVAERLIEGVLNGEARSYLTFENDGSSGWGRISPIGDSWCHSDTAIAIDGLHRLARFDGGGAADFDGSDLPFGSRSEEESFTDASVATGEALRALGLESGCDGNECLPDYETDGRTSTQEDSIIPARGSWFGKFAAAQDPDKWGWYAD